MENETAAQNGTAANEANVHQPDATMEPRLTPERPAVRYLTDEEAEWAAEKVFRVHHRLLAALADS